MPKHISTIHTVLQQYRTKIDELQRKKEGSISTTKTNELFSWWNYSNEANKQIGQKQTWKLILEALNTIHYED